MRQRPRLIRSATRMRRPNIMLVAGSHIAYAKPLLTCHRLVRQRRNPTKPFHGNSSPTTSREAFFDLTRSFLVFHHNVLVCPLQRLQKVNQTQNLTTVFSPDRAHLRRLELMLNSITKEEKRVRVKEAELRESWPWCWETKAKSIHTPTRCKGRNLPCYRQTGKVLQWCQKRRLKTHFNIRKPLPTWCQIDYRGTSWRNHQQLKKSSAALPQSIGQKV